MNNPRIYNIANEETYQDGEYVFKDGSAGDWLYTVLSGSIEISKTVKGEKHIFEILNPGEVFGELGFIGGIKRTATARAIGETTLGILDRNFLEKEFNQLTGEFRFILETTVLRFEKMLNRAFDFKSRIEPRVIKTLTLKFKDRQAFVRAYTANLSKGGLFIKTEHPLNTGDEFLLKLHSPDIPSPLQIKCKVRWTLERENARNKQPPGMGVKFGEMSKKDYQFLQECLKASGPGK